MTAIFMCCAGLFIVNYCTLQVFGNHLVSLSVTSPDNLDTEFVQVIDCAAPDVTGKHDGYSLSGRISAIPEWQPHPSDTTGLLDSTIFSDEIVYTVKFSECPKCSFIEPLWTGKAIFIFIFFLSYLDIIGDGNCFL